MRVAALFASDRLSGSNVTARALLDELARRWHDVDCAPDEAEVLVAHLDDPPALVRVARETDVPLVVLVRRAAELREIDARHVSLTVFPSRTVAAEAHWPGRSIVVYPSVRVVDYRVCPYGDPTCPCPDGVRCHYVDDPEDGTKALTPPPREHRVTLVNLSAASGSDLFYELARRMPDTPFLGVRGAVGLQLVAPDCPNLEVVGPVENMREVYARTGVLLMPGEQTFGRPAVEAGCSNIPTVAHPSDGAREALGDAAYWVSRERFDEWLKALRLLERPGGYRAFGEKAFRRAVLLDPTDGFRRFESELQLVVSEGRVAYSDPTYWRGR